MANISSIVSALGAGSGIDMAALATNLANAQFQVRAERLTARSETLERQISSASTLKNMVSTLAAAMGDRVRSGDLSPQPVVANAAVASASSPLGTTGKGSYTLEVSALASAQTLTSPSFAGGDTVVGSGSLIFKFGTATASRFTQDTSHEPVTLTFGSKATLNDVAAAINAQGMGINAYVAQTTSGAQLVMKGEEGQANGFIIEQSKAQTGLRSLAWAPGGGSAAARLLTTAGDASFKLDGLAMTSASNNTGAVAPGLSLKLTGTNVGAPTKITFGNPVENITGAMQDFLGALNEVVAELNTATDAMTGDLARDPGAQALKRALAQIGTELILPSAAEGSPRTLAELGLAIQRDGTFRLDTARLEAVLEKDPAGVAAMFTPGLNGVYATLDRVARNATTTGNPGSLGGSIARYQAQSVAVSKGSMELAEKQEALRATLTARFSKADTRISASQSTLSFLQAQIDAWNGGKE